MNRYLFFIVLILFLIAGLGTPVEAQKPYGTGTTTGNFLEIGYGSAGLSMGDAYVSCVNDLSAIYWNPAGLAYMDGSAVQFMSQPWIVGINTSFTGFGLVIPNMGTIALGIFQVGYGDIAVTTMEMQEGTGEQYTANDLSINLAYGRKLAQWFSFGASVKYISSKIWHMTANAFAIDLGVIVNTQFFSFTGKREDCMRIGMSISNYGTKMKFEGIDQLNYIDILPYEEGNYKYVKGEFGSDGWDLPLLFRLGASIDPIVKPNHRLTIAFDLLHTNNINEYVNIGTQYKFSLPTAGDIFLRAGYKGMAMEDSQFGLTFGGGVNLRMMHNTAIKLEYAYRNVGLFGDIHAYTVGIKF